MTPLILVEELSWISEGTCVLQLMETRKPNQGAWQAMGGKRMLPPPRKDICILILRACDYVPSRGPGESRLQVELRL